MNYAHVLVFELVSASLMPQTTVNRTEAKYIKNIFRIIVSRWKVSLRLISKSVRFVLTEEGTAVKFSWGLMKLSDDIRVEII